MLQRSTASAIMEIHRTRPIRSIPIHVPDDDDDDDSKCNIPSSASLTDVSKNNILGKKIVPKILQGGEDLTSVT
jgi:hypothetical protein